MTKDETSKMFLEIDAAIAAIKPLKNEDDCYLLHVEVGDFPEDAIDCLFGYYKLKLQEKGLSPYVLSPKRHGVKSTNPEQWVFFDE